MIFFPELPDVKEFEKKPQDRQTDRPTKFVLLLNLIFTKREKKGGSLLG